MDVLNAYVYIRYHLIVPFHRSQPPNRPSPSLSSPFSPTYNVSTTYRKYAKRCHLCTKYHMYMYMEHSGDNSKAVSTVLFSIETVWQCFVIISFFLLSSPLYYRIRKDFLVFSFFIHSWFGFHFCYLFSSCCFFYVCVWP